ncbi:hypothetical protein [Leptospira adleri]|nr:hypothetical protein [Leptospira adleri]
MFRRSGEVVTGKTFGRLLPMGIGRTALGPGFVAKATHPSLAPFLKEK